MERARMDCGNANEQFGKANVPGVQDKMHVTCDSVAEQNVCCTTVTRKDGDVIGNKTLTNENEKGNGISDEASANVEDCGVSKYIGSRWTKKGIKIPRMAGIASKKGGPTTNNEIVYNEFGHDVQVEGNKDADLGDCAKAKHIENHWNVMKVNCEQSSEGAYCMVEDWVTRRSRNYKLRDIINERANETRESVAR